MNENYLRVHKISSDQYKKTLESREKESNFENLVQSNFYLLLEK